MELMEVKMDELVGYRVTSSTICILEESGFWKVTQKVIQEKKVEGKDWEKREAVVSSVFKDLEEASNDAMMSMAYYLKSVDGDLFSADKKELEEKVL